MNRFSSEFHRPNLRIANFSDISLETDNVLNFAKHILQEVVETIRQYADLPYVFITKSLGDVEEVLVALRSMRSPCYPRAILVIEDGPDGTEVPGVDIILCKETTPAEIMAVLDEYAREHLVFDTQKMNNNNDSSLPEKVDVVIVGGGITGLYSANRLAEKNISFCIVEEREIAGGIWSMYANTTSQVNTSEGAYRVLDHENRSNRDHSSTSEMLEDLFVLVQKHSPSIYTSTKAVSMETADAGYRVAVIRGEEKSVINSKGIILAINDRIGDPRLLTWNNQDHFQGKVIAGISDNALGIDWKGKNVVIVGMGAFAIENVRTALENGASHVTVVCRRHGTVCPKIIDYLNFATPYDENFQHEKKSNIRNMMLWKKLYDQSGAAQPECWMGKIKHDGHTISVSDIWFIGHHLGMLSSVSGSITSMYKNGVIVNGGEKVEADIVVNCVGFHRKAPVVKEMCDYREMYNTNYVDKDFMYLADAYIDDDVFNSFFGSSVLEMTKFYMDVYIDYFDNEAYEEMISLEGVKKISIEDRRWSHYMAGADALIKQYPRFYEAAKKQIETRTANFLETHDLKTYIAENKREWLDTHTLLNGEPLSEDKCLPYVFEKLLK